MADLSKTTKASDFTIYQHVAIDSFISKSKMRSPVTSHLPRKLRKYVDFLNMFRSSFLDSDSTVNDASYHGSAMCAVTIHYPNSYYRGTVDGSRRRGKPRKSWGNSIKEWTSRSLSSLLRVADDRSRWATIAAECLLESPQRCLSVTGVS